MITPAMDINMAPSIIRIMDPDMALGCSMDSMDPGSYIDYGHMYGPCDYVATYINTAYG